jgi:hypothetical protein
MVHGLVGGRAQHWIDADGRLRRFSAQLGGATDWLLDVVRVTSSHLTAGPRRCRANGSTRKMA